MFLSLKYRLYPNKAQTFALQRTLDLCRELYNAALQERRDAWRMQGKNVRWADQMSQLSAVKETRPEYRGVYSQVTQNVLMRLHQAYASFFSTCKKGGGHPRFKPAQRYNSFTYPQHGFGIVAGKLKLSKIGSLRIKLHRPIDGTIKQLTILRDAGKWYAVFKCEVATHRLPASVSSIGIDVGLTHFATLSDGTEIENPRHFRNAQRYLRRVQRAVSRKKKGGANRKKAVRNLQRVHARIRNQRSDFHHKLSRTLVNTYGLIAVEDLNIRGLAAGMLSKHVNDAGWGSFLDKLSYKAESAGREVVKVPAAGTSQHCLCGHRVSKTLKDRWHSCPECGLEGKRDVVSAQLILRLGLSLSELTQLSGANVSEEAAKAE